MIRTAAALLLLSLASLVAHAQTIVCFGDSLTAGQGAAPGNSYPDFLRKDLAAAGFHGTVVNQGVSGDTTKDGLSRMAQVLRAHPSIVILELGANDGIRGQMLPGIEHNLSIMIQAFQRAHIQVLLAGIDLPPNLGADYVKQFDAIYPELAKRYKLPLIPFLLQGVYGVFGLMSQDYIHPNDAGYEKVALTVQDYLQPMLTHAGASEARVGGPLR